MSLGVQAWGPYTVYPPVLLCSLGYGLSFHLSSDRTTGSLALSVGTGLPPPCPSHRKHHPALGAGEEKGLEP